MAAERNKGSSFPSEKKRLLIVTNREEMRRLRAILKTVVAHIDWAADAPSAHTALETRSDYDAVIVDDKLSEDGWKNVMESAQDLGINAPFLVCTQKEGADRFLTQSKSVLIADLLMRPYDDALVQARVRRALEMENARPFQGATEPSHQ